VYVFPDVLDLTLAALEQKTSSAVTPMYIPPHGCGHASDLCAALFQHHCKDIDGARQGPFHPSTGKKVLLDGACVHSILLQSGRCFDFLGQDPPQSLSESTQFGPITPK
jgi:hypothetical protein